MIWTTCDPPRVVRGSGEVIFEPRRRRDLWLNRCHGMATEAGLVAAVLVVWQAARSRRAAA